MFTYVNSCKHTGRPWVTATLQQLWHPALVTVCTPAGIHSPGSETAPASCALHCERDPQFCGCPATGPCMQPRALSGPWAGEFVQVIGYIPRLCPFDGNRSLRGMATGDLAASVGIVQSLMLPPVWSERLSPSSSRQTANKVRREGT